MPPPPSAPRATTGRGAVLVPARTRLPVREKSSRLLLSSARLEPPSPMFAEMSPRKSRQALTARSPSAAARTWGRRVSKYPSTISVPPGRNSSIAHRYGSTLAIRLNRAPLDVRAVHSQGKASIMPRFPVRNMPKNGDRRCWMKTCAPGECDSARPRAELHVAADPGLRTASDRWGSPRSRSGSGDCRDRRPMTSSRAQDGRGVGLSVDDRDA